MRHCGLLELRRFVVRQGLGIFSIIRHINLGEELPRSSRGEEADSIPDQSQEIILVTCRLGKLEDEYHEQRFQVLLRVSLVHL